MPAKIGVSELRPGRYDELVIERLYNWTMAFSGHRGAVWALAAISFAESSVFPIPPDILLIPMILATRASAWKLATVCTVASVCGGFAGYGIGYYLYESVGQNLISLYGQIEKFDSFQAAYYEWGAWIVAAAGVTPFPYKVITIASGLVQLDLLTFGTASALGRGARFFVEAGLLWWFGPAIRVFVEARLNLMATMFLILLLAGFLILK